MNTRFTALLMLIAFALGSMWAEAGEGYWKLTDTQVTSTPEEGNGWKNHADLGNHALFDTLLLPQGLRFVSVGDWSRPPDVLLPGARVEMRVRLYVERSQLPDFFSSHNLSIAMWRGSLAPPGYGHDGVTKIASVSVSSHRDANKRDERAGDLIVPDHTAGPRIWISVDGSFASRVTYTYTWTGSRPPTGDVQAKAGALPPEGGTSGGATAAVGYTWKPVGIGDCPAHDTASSQGATPAPERCNASTAGRAAVCWDGARQRHHDFGNAACTYKDLTAAQCTGGHNPGFMYRCEAAAMLPLGRPHSGSTSAGGEAAPSGAEAVIFRNGNDMGVQNGGTPAHFSLDRSTRITRVLTYHYNFGRGAKAGTIAIRAVSGETYGPWPVQVQNLVYWIARPYVVLPPGQYEIVDSDLATWSQNDGSQGEGHVVISGMK